MAEKPVTEPAEGAPVETASEPLPPEAAAEMQDERDDYRDKWMRKSAEFDNYRKRVERERREQADQAVTDLLSELLLVVDDFDRALTVEPPEEDAGGDAYRRGVELIQAKLHEVLRKRGARPIEALGTVFDPNLHQAVIHESSPDHT